MLKNNKFYIIILILSIIASFGFALDLNTVCSQLSLNPVTKGDFTQVKTINSSKGKRELKSYGTFLLCPDGIIWNTAKPFPSDMIIGKTKIVQTASDGKQSVIDGTDNQVFSSISSSVTAVFSNNIDEINKNFITDFTDLGSGSWKLALKPRDATIASVLGEISLTGCSANGSTTLDSLIVKESQDSIITYLFSNQIYSKELTSDEKAFFAF